MSLTVAVVGATGNVGRRMLEVLERRNFPVGRLIPLASARSVGAHVTFRGQSYPVQELTPASLEGVDLALASAGARVSREYTPIAVAAGAVVVDNSSAWRMDPGVPLVVPECNAAALAQHRGIIANPNCSTAQMVVALNPIHHEAGLARLVIATYQSVSGTGKAAVDECIEQARDMLATGARPGPGAARVYPHPIAFNVIPQVDVFLDDGYTKEEHKMMDETRKILGDDAIRITATTVRVPVLYCHSEAVNVETRRPFTMERVRELLAAAPGVVVVDDPASSGYPTPHNAEGRDETFVGRLRRDPSHPQAFDMFIVADNLLKGAALNAVQIAEELIRRNLLGRQRT